MVPVESPKPKQRPEPSWFAKMNWEEKRAWSETNWKPTHGSERDYHQVYFGKDTPAEQNDLIRACKFSHRLWSTYTFRTPPTNNSGFPMMVDDVLVGIIEHFPTSSRLKSTRSSGLVLRTPCRTKGSTFMP